MEGIDRRSALSLGLVGALAPLLASSGPARAQADGDLVPNYSPTDGEELGPGVRLVEVGSRASHIPAYSGIQVIDIVFQPGASDPPEGAPMPAMEMDMVCFILAGSFRIEKEGLDPFDVTTGEFYSCGMGTKEKATNTGPDVGIHRIALLMPA